jgi:geranylgeranyl pyrophosphate synthase
MLTGDLDDKGREALLKKLQDSGMLDQTRERALEFAAAARKNLEVLPETEYRVALGELTSFVIERGG